MSKTTGNGAYPGRDQQQAVGALIVGLAFLRPERLAELYPSIAIRRGRTAKRILERRRGEETKASNQPDARLEIARRHSHADDA